MSIRGRLQLCGAICLTLLFIEIGSLPFARAQSSPSRPSLFIGQEHLEQLTSRIQGRNSLWAAIVDWGREPERGKAQLQDGPGLALTFAVLKMNAASRVSKEQGKLAKQCALEAIKNPASDHILSASDQICDTALTLDWAWEAFTAEERRRTGLWLVRQASRFSGQTFSPFSSEHAAQLRLLSLAGLAARGLDPGAELLQQTALNNKYKKELEPCLLNLGKGGGWFEDSIAGARAGLHIIQSVAAFKSAKGVDLFSSVPWFQDRIQYLIFSTLPRTSRLGALNYFPVFPGGDRSLAPQVAADYQRLQVMMLIELMPQADTVGWAQAWLMHHQRPVMTNPTLRPYEFIFMDPVRRQTPLVTAPRLWQAESVGQVFMRSDWSPRATWVKFSSGPHFAARQHLDAGSVQLFKDTLLLPPGGAYDRFDSSHVLNYASRSIAQNTLRIIDPQEYSWQELRAGKQPAGTYSNDGGQRSFSAFTPQGGLQTTAPWNSSGWNTGEAPFQKLSKLYGLGSLSAAEAKMRFQYARGDITPAYQGSTNKAQRVVRHLVHLLGGGPQDPGAAGVVVIIDDVVLNRPQAEVRFVAHLPGKPDISKSLKEEGPGRYSGEADRVIYKNRTGNLELVNVVPGKTSLHVFGRVGHAASWVNGKNYPTGQKSEFLSTWRVEFSAGKGGDSKARPMITALLPSNLDDPASPNVRALPSPQADTVGVIVLDAFWPRVVAAKLGGPKKSVQVKYNYPAGRSRHLVLGLVPEISYSVKLENNQITISPGEGLTSSPAGTLAFVVEPEPQASASKEK